jgi:hypothetical protein
MKLQVGMNVVIIDDVENFVLDAGKTKLITKIDEPYGIVKEREFELDNDTNGIWLLEDFEYCVEYPDALMQ